MYLLLAWLLVTGASAKCSHNCYLNGDCVDSVCKCDPAWTGKLCNKLNLQPANPNSGYHAPDRSSWGGNILYEDGMYHLFAAEFVNNCGLDAWQLNSRIVRATAKDPQGPYEFAQEVFSHFGHNPQITRAPGGMYGLYFIGGWTTNADNCTKIELRHPGTIPSQIPKFCGWGGLGGCGIAFATSHSIYGPWSPSRFYIENQYPQTWACDLSNPTPWIFPNGSALVAWEGLVCKPEFVLEEKMGISFGSQWDDTTTFSLIPHEMFSNFNISNEDPFLWQDKRGFHLLMHALGDKTVYWPGAYAYSINGYDWTYSPEAVYTFKADFTDNTTITFQRRERPKLLFNSEGQITHLVNGVQPYPPNCTKHKTEPTCDAHEPQCFWIHSKKECSLSSREPHTYTFVQPVATSG